jgi:hypothetical protein
VYELHSSPARQACAASASAPVTTSTEVQREASAAFTARRSMAMPPTGCNSLLAPPMRRLLPAASTSAATLRPAGARCASGCVAVSSSSASAGLRIRPPTPIAMISARPMGRPASRRCSTQSRPLVRRERAQPGRMMTGMSPSRRQQQHVARLDRHAEMEDLAAGGDDGGRHRVGAILGHGAAGNQDQVAAGGPRFQQRRRDGRAAVRAALHQAEVRAKLVEPAPAAGHRRRVVARDRRAVR